VPHRTAVLFAFTTALLGQSSITNTGQPMRIAFECTEADSESAGLTCSPEEPCPLFLELGNLETAGNKIFITGNFHSSSTTLYSLLLESEDAGKTWTEPHERIRFSGLDQIQFIDFQNGWISGASLQGAPRDPFFLITTDGGKTWRKRPVFEESRVATIERFVFESRENGVMLVDARLDNNRHELYESMTGGESWSLKEASASAIRFPKARDTGSSGWRIRADAPTKSFLLERQEAEKWRKEASFLISIGSCKQ